MGSADLHIHTRVSDGMATVEAVLEHIETRTSLDVVAITDHEDAAGGLRARELAAAKGYRFEVVVGAEVTTRQGHLLALFVEECPKSFRSIEATLEAIHAAGGLAVIPHPMSWLTRSLSRRTIGRIVVAGGPGVGFDAIETQNPSLAGQVTAERVARANVRWRLPEVGGSDAHHLAHIGCGRTAFEGTTAAELRAAIETGATSASSVAYPPARQVGYGQIALGLAWGYSATPRKMLRRASSSRENP